MKTYFIIAGEPSGDLQASKLMTAMNRVTDCHWHGIGGDLMIAEGLNLLKHMNKMAFMGIVEVIKHLKQIFSNLNMVRKSIKQLKPDAVILIDYPGFNLKVAKQAKHLGVKVIYYITPQLWAWHESRVKLMKKYVDEIINVFPFEVDFYKRHGIESHYFGHPLMEGLKTEFDTKNKFLESLNIDLDKKIVGILPGSRRDEVKHTMQILNQYISKNSDKFFIISKVNHIDESEYQVKGENSCLLEMNTYDIMKFSDYIIVTSGTATLETACFETPMVVIYRTSALTFYIAKRVIKIPNVSLVNIVAEKEIVPELLQEEFTLNKLEQSVKSIEENYAEIKLELKKVRDNLVHEDVSAQVAKYILSVS